MSITEISIKRPLLITVIFVTLILFGFMSYQTLSYNLLPKMETNSLFITTTYMGASPEEVQTSVTKLIEDAVAAIEGVDQLSSSSQEGASRVTVTLKSDADMKEAQLQAERKISEIRASLPAFADEPVVKRFSVDDMPVVKLSVTSSLDGPKLFDFIDLQVKPLLTNIEGVAQVDITGGTQRQIKVSLDNNKLSAYKLSMAEINKAVTNSGASFPAGAIKNEVARFSIDLNAKVNSVEQLRNVVVRQNDDGSRVLLGDVAQVSDSEKEPTTFNRINETNAIGIQIKKQSDANAVNVSTDVRKRLEEIKVNFASQDFNYEIASDQSIYTIESADGVIHDLFLAIVIVAMVMLFFLHSARSASFVLVAIPAAMIPTFIGMWYFGFSLNLMTLLGLSLVVGILVDDSIVVLENIYRHMEMGKDKRTASIEGRNEIGFTAMAITLVDVVVFLPLALAGGLIGNILKEYALVVVFSTLMSLLVAFTLTPLLASRWGKVAHLNNENIWGRVNLVFESWIDQFREFYTQVLTWCLGHKRYVFLIVFGLIVGSIALIPGGFVGANFMPTTDRGELTIQLDLSSEAPLIQTNKTVAEIEHMLFQHPEVVKIFSNVGTQGTSYAGSSGTNSNLAEMTVILVNRKERDISTDEFSDVVREEILQIPGVNPTMKMAGMTGNTTADMQLIVKGSNVDSVMAAAKLVKNIVIQTPGADYVQLSVKDAKRKISITLNREKMARLGLGVSDLGTSVQYAFAGNDKTKFRDNGEEYDINLELDEKERQSIDDIRNLNVYNTRGETIQLSEVADIRETIGYGVLERTDRMASIQINAAAMGRPSGSIMNDINKALEGVKLPEGTYIEKAGSAKNQADAIWQFGAGSCGWNSFDVFDHGGTL